MEKEYIVHGRQLNVTVPNHSVGMQLITALKEKEERPIFIDAITGQNISNKDLLYNSCRLAQSLRSYGLKKKDRIGVCSENNLHFFDPILAALYCGITAVPISAQYTERELQNAVDLVQPLMIFCSSQTSRAVCNLKDRLKVVPKIIINQTENQNGFQSVENFISEYLPKNFNVNHFEASSVDAKENVALILFSSGTTGLPKGVMLTHLNISTAFVVSVNRRPAKQHTVNVMFVPMYHAYGLFMGLFRILSKSKIIMLNKFSPNLYLKTIQDYKIRTLHLVPSVAQLLAKSTSIQKYDLSGIKELVCGAAPLSKEIQEQLVKRFKIPYVQQRYGMTETTIGVLGEVNDNSWVTGSCGSVYPLLSAKIIDTNTGQSLGPMNTGELCFRGNVIMKGYLNNPEATKAAIDVDGWLHTGDLAYYDENGLFYIVDRLKELIKCNGYQVSPVELEGILLNHSKIVDAGVIGIPNERYDEVPLAFVVKAQNEKLSEKEVEDFIKGQVAAYKQLRGGVQFVNHIPRNPSGKILRKMLRDAIHKNKSNL